MINFEVDEAQREPKASHYDSTNLKQIKSFVVLIV